MNIIDIILLLCFIPAVINGIRKGLIAQVIAILVLIVGTWLSYKFATLIGGWMVQWINTSQQLLNIIAFVIIFIIVALVLNMVGKILEKTIKIILLGWLNRLLGVAFSLLKWFLILGLLILVFDALNGTFHFVAKDYVNQSFLYRPMLDLVNKVFPYIRGLVSDWTA